MSSRRHFSPEFDNFSHLYLIPATLRPNFCTNKTSVLHWIMAASIHKVQGWANGSHYHIFLKISIHPSQFKLDFGSTFVPFESGDHFFLENSFMHISNSNTQSNILRQTFILKPTCVLGLTSQMNVKSNTYVFLLQLLLKFVVLSTFYYFFFP